MVRPSKSKAVSAPNTSTAYDLTAASTSLEEVDKDLVPAAYDMSGLTEALGEAERRTTVTSTIRMRAFLASCPCCCARRNTPRLIPLALLKKPRRRIIRSRPTVDELMILHRDTKELRRKAMEEIYRLRISQTTENNMSET